MTLHEAVTHYCDHHLSVRYKDWKRQVADAHRYLLKLPNVALEAVSRAQVVAWHNGIGQQYRAAANAALRQLSLLYRKMVEWEHYDGRNPAQYIKPFKRQKRHVVMQPTDVPAILMALQLELLEIRLAFLTIMITGCRLNELRMMLWEAVNLETGRWMLPPPKNGEPHSLNLPQELVVFYRDWARAGRQPYVFTETGTEPWGKTTMERHWDRIRQRAKVPHLRIHDLRRTLLSHFCNAGQKDVAQMIANHRSVRTTEHYWVRGESPVVTAALAAYAQRLLHPPNEGARQEEGLA